MFTSFHSKGTIPSCSDVCKWRTNLFYSFFQYLGDIPSTPGDLFSFILLILLDTTSEVTNNCPNLSPSDSLNFVSGTGNEQVSSLIILY